MFFFLCFRLAKNREAARECRNKKKEYIKAWYTSKLNIVPTKYNKQEHSLRKSHVPQNYNIWIFIWFTEYKKLKKIKIALTIISFLERKDKYILTISFRN